MVLLEKKDTTVYSDDMLMKVLDKVLEKVKVDRDYDIPYTAGYSTDGGTVYIDRRLPKSYEGKGGKVVVYPFLIMHETVEKALIDQLGLNYMQAHQIALRAEEGAVLAFGYDWKEYDNFMQDWTKKILDGKIESVPADLDMTPYEDMDSTLVPKMREAMK